MIKIKQLTSTSIEEIHEAFSRAFADYVEPFDLTKDQLQYMIERRGCDFNLSVGAFHEDKLVGLTLNGMGEWNGKRTAYDTGTGVVKEFRKQGIATKMFVESLPILKEHGISQYLLEVICENTSAFELYKKAGFKVVRNFDYFIAEKGNLKFGNKSISDEFSIREIEKPNWNLFKTFWEFNPSWQNSIDSINRKFEFFKTLGVFKKDELVGYGIIEKHTGDIPQFAIRKEYRRMKIGTVLLKELSAYGENKIIKFVNTESTYEPLKKFAENIEFPVGLGQYEMTLDL